MIEASVIELNQEMASGGHNHPRVTQLRGRVAELMRQVNGVNSNVNEERVRGFGPQAYYSLNR